MPDTQYFTNIDGKYVKDAEARQQLNDLEDYVESLDQPWQPLQDGYSNFWFELTNDTLSPWLNFSAKTKSAVIDWGDGSGEQALTTLTPTHTYAKAGRYIVKCKGVTGLAKQANTPYNGNYLRILKYVEMSGISNLALSTFLYLGGLQKIVVSQEVTAIPSYFCQYCGMLTDIIYNSNAITEIQSAAYSYCTTLTNIDIPSGVQSIGNSAFSTCVSLSEIHCKPTTPPTLGTNVFVNMSSNFIIYVPVGYGDTYKAASGWSTYADHILEEGQTPNRMMLAKFGSAGPGEEEEQLQEDMR